MSRVKTKGFNELESKLKMDFTTALSRAVLLVATIAENEAKINLKRQTNVITGQLLRSIIQVKVGKTGRRLYVGKEYGKYIEYGRGEIKAKNKLLYIPISIKAKRLGSNRSAGLVFGKDFVLAKRSRATKARPFFRPAIDEARKQTPSILRNQIKKLYV